jgi:hypothetical protein
MYVGDKSRDASNKLRGFIFQDYITISCLLKDEVEYVCAEYIEDVDVFYSDGRFEFIQVKYYPNTLLNRKEIFTDLYYQYLRLQILQSKLIAKPSLHIHGKHVIAKPKLQDMINYIGIGSNPPKTITNQSVEDTKNWLINNIYSTSKKEEQKERTFRDKASEDSLEGFINNFDIFSQHDIVRYKEELMDELEKKFPKTPSIRDKENWKFVLLGLAIVYVQKRYTLAEHDFESLRFEKTDFTKYMTESTQNNIENIIVNYLVGISSEIYGDIVNDGCLSDLQVKRLNQIYHNTIHWIEDNAEKAEWQYGLLNTLSIEDESKVSGYCKLPIENRIIKIAECKSSYMMFLQYMWKIMLNLCQDNNTQVDDNTIDPEMLKPDYYIDSTINEYLCFNFPQDKYVDRCVILPNPGGNFSRVTRKIASRMIKQSSKPQKWFYENDKKLNGKNYYNYSTANVAEKSTVADLGEDSFYIECMKCIGIDAKEWCNYEKCRDCIFAVKCVKGEEKS